MTSLRARITLTALSLVTLAVAINALYLQEEPRQKKQGPTTSVSITELEPMAAEKSADAWPISKGPPQDPGLRLKAAIARELLRKGYGEKGEVSLENLAKAVLAYEFDSGLTLSGQPSQAVLKQLLFDGAKAPRGPFADRAERDQTLVLEVQKTLLGLGFFSGALSGRMDSWTEKALMAYQHHRGLGQDGRLREETLLDLIAYAGAAFRQTAER